MVLTAFSNLNSKSFLALVVWSSFIFKMLNSAFAYKELSLYLFVFDPFKLSNCLNGAFIFRGDLNPI